MKSLPSVLQALSFDPTLARLLATTPSESVERLGEWVASTDPYNEGHALSAALGLVCTSGDPREHVLHQLRCASRQAAWTSGLATPLPVRAEGLAHLSETNGHATLLVTPMTLAPGDAMCTIAQLNDSGRPCLVFGEDFDLRQHAESQVEIVSGMSTRTVRRILQVLDEGGVLCTYPDFVYETRAAETIRLFGVERPIASGFISLASRDDTMLLPLVCSLDDEGVAVHIDEPVRIESGGDAGTPDRMHARTVICRAVGELLEGLIRRAPEQWLLLPTLTFESPEMASRSS